jgi:hypothetical protein
MKDDVGKDTPGDKNVAEYKIILRKVLDNRPSGTRLKLAAALGKNRSSSAIRPAPSVRHFSMRMAARTPEDCAHPTAKRARVSLP